MKCKMFRIPGAAAIALALLCATASPLGAKDKNLNPRPIKATGYMTITVTPNPTSPIAPFLLDEIGNGTHLGLYHNVGNGTMDLSTGAWLGAEGTCTAANGRDTFNWVTHPDYTTVISGGTGKFENASWSFVPNVVFLSAPVPNPDGTFTMYMVYTIDTEGTF